MTPRLTFDQSCARLRDLKLLPPAARPVLPDRRPSGPFVDNGVGFVRQMIANVKLHDLYLPRTVIARCEFRAVHGRNLDLSESVANWNDFIKVDFTEAELSRADFRACLFNGVRFHGASLVDVDFRYCGFKNCDFTAADLSGARLTQKVGRALQLTPEQQGVIDWQSEDGAEPPEV